MLILNLSRVNSQTQPYGWRNSCKSYSHSIFTTIKDNNGSGGSVTSPQPLLILHVLEYMMGHANGAPPVHNSSFFFHIGIVIPIHKGDNSVVVYIKGICWQKMWQKL